MTNSVISSQFILWPTKCQIYLEARTVWLHGEYFSRTVINLHFQMSMMVGILGPGQCEIYHPNVPSSHGHGGYIYQNIGKDYDQYIVPRRLFQSYYYSVQSLSFCDMGVALDLVSWSWNHLWNPQPSKPGNPRVGYFRREIERSGARTKSCLGLYRCTTCS